MKCIKATRTTKQYNAGDIRRVSDREADSATKDGYWQYVAKSEWKAPKKNEEISVQEPKKQKSK